MFKKLSKYVNLFLEQESEELYQLKDGEMQPVNGIFRKVVTSPEEISEIEEDGYYPFVPEEITDNTLETKIFKK
jgi:carbamate kinase